PNDLCAHFSAECVAVTLQNSAEIVKFSQLFSAGSSGWVTIGACVTTERSTRARQVQHQCTDEFRNSRRAISTASIQNARRRAASPWPPPPHSATAPIPPPR